MLAQTELPHSRSIQLVCTLLVLLGSAIAECDAPPYRDGFILADSKSEILMHASIQETDFAPTRLLCLADALKQRFQNRNKITVIIFSSHKAAKNWMLRPQAPTKENAALQETLHAIYVYDSDKQADYIRLIPYPAYSSLETPFDTKIERRSTGAIHCRLAISDRCLLTMHRVEYPPEAFKDAKSGNVTLVGTIGTDGKMKNVQVSRQDKSDETVFANWATRNLRTWRFEPAKQSTQVHITYSYKIGDTHDPYQLSVVQFNLPDDVMITARSPKP